MGLFDLIKKNKKEKSPVVEMGIQEHTNVNWENEIVPIENRIKKSEPACNGLYPHEVLVLSYADKYKTQANKFPGFWWYKYGIKDVQSILEKLLRLGFIAEAEASKLLSSQKVTTLKDLLKEYNLSTSGKKDDLVRKCLEGISEEDIENHFPVKSYALTDIGEKTLEKYKGIPYVHHHSIDEMDIWLMSDMINNSTLQYRDIIWEHFNKIGLNYMKDGHFGLYRNVKFQMSEFVYEEHRIEQAFNLLCEVIAYDLSGLGNNFDPEFLKCSYDFFYPYENSIVTVAPGIIQRIKKYSEELVWNKDDLYNQLLLGIECVPLLFSVFEPNEKTEIVLATINEDIDTIHKIYKSSEKRFRQQFGIK